IVFTIDEARREHALEERAVALHDAGGPGVLEAQDLARGSVLRERWRGTQGQRAQEQGQGIAHGVWRKGWRRARPQEGRDRKKGGEGRAGGPEEERDRRSGATARTARPQKDGSASGG